MRPAKAGTCLPTTDKGQHHLRRAGGKSQGEAAPYYRGSPGHRAWCREEVPSSAQDLSEALLVPRGSDPVPQCSHSSRPPPAIRAGVAGKSLAAASPQPGSETWSSAEHWEACFPSGLRPRFHPLRLMNYPRGGWRGGGFSEVTRSLGLGATASPAPLPSSPHSGPHAQSSRSNPSRSQSMPGAS